MKANKSGIEASDLLVGAAVLGGAWMLKDAFKGIGKGAEGVGKGVEDVGSGVGKLFGDIGGTLSGLEKDLASGLGSWGRDFGKAIDLEDAGKWAWLSGSQGILANAGNELGTVGHNIDLTDPNSLIRKNPVTDFVGWLNPWD